MNKLDTTFQNSSSKVSLSYDSVVTTARSLVVLVPNADLDYAIATRRVWELEIELRAHILFVGLCKDTTEESSLRRQLVTMAAMVQDGNASAEVKVKVGNNWIEVVKSDRQIGDVIVCFAEQRAGLFFRPLSQILQSNLNMPVYILSGLYPPDPSRIDILSILRLWIGLLGIVAGSFLLQIRIIALPRDWSQTTLLLLSVTAELWLIWVWNNLFS